MKTKTRKAEILSYGDEQKLIKLKTIVSKEAAQNSFFKSKSANQYCSLLDLSGKKILDYREHREQCGNSDIQSLVNVICYANFFVKEHSFSHIENECSKERKASYQIYTYSGKALACGSDSWNYDEEEISKMEKLAEEAENATEQEI